MSTLLNLFITALIISISTATPICLSTNHNHLKSPQSDICIWDQFRQSERYADPSNFVCAFHVQHRIGRGSYGDVHLAKDWMTGTEVAYKFSTGSSKAARYLMHEVVVLEQLRSGLDAYPLASRGIVKNLNHTRLPTGKVIVVYELMSIDLAHLLARDIKAIDDVNKRHEHHVSPLGRRRVTAVIKQMLRDILPVLAYLRDKRYVHADVKPTNILFNSTTGHFKLHDFSFAGPQGQREKMQGTLEYMSPEIYSRKLYTPAADMWALGCAVMAVYSNAHPFRFKKLQNGRDITVYWEKFLGPIPAPLLMTLEHANMNNPEAHRSVLHARPLIDQVLHKDQLLLDLVKRMLKYNRDERLTPQQALQHPFLNDVI